MDTPQQSQSSTPPQLAQKHDILEQALNASNITSFSSAPLPVSVLNTSANLAPGLIQKPVTSASNVGPTDLSSVIDISSAAAQGTASFNPATQLPIGTSAAPVAPDKESIEDYQRLKVEDALAYLDDVKSRFKDVPQVYNEFLDIMKDFKSQSIDTPGVIHRVSNLFRGNKKLIVGFNTFLPPGYRIDVTANDEITVEQPGNQQRLVISSHTAPVTPLPATPLGKPQMTAAVAATTANTVSGALTAVVAAASTEVIVHSAPPPASLSGVFQPSVSSATPVISRLPESFAPFVSQARGLAPPPASFQTIDAAQYYRPGNAAQFPACSQGLSPEAQLLLSQQHGSQPVEFNHAINYVNKIKNRFQHQPDIYKRFLEILHTYQKEQKTIKEKNFPAPTEPKRPLTENEVYSQVSELFENQEDLLSEFGQFLPDATGGSSAFIHVSLPAFDQLDSNLGFADSPQTPPRSAQRAPSVVSLEPPSSVGRTPPIVESPPFQQAARTAGLPSSQPRRGSGMGPVSSVQQTTTKVVSHYRRERKLEGRHRRSPSYLRDVSLVEAAQSGSASDFALFDRIKQSLGSQEVYENFLRCLHLYTQEVVSKEDLLQIVQPFLCRHPEHYRDLRELLGYGDKGQVYDPLPPKAVQRIERNAAQSQMLQMEIDYATCKKYGVSYRALPGTFQQPKCSGRNQLCREVLNDTWVSFPTWSEDSSQVHNKKNQFEEAIYRCEDERFELDIVLETNLATVRILEAVQKKISKMSSEEGAKFRLDNCLGGTSEVIHRKAIHRIYGDKVADIIEGLKRNPLVAIPLVLRRLKSKHDEWKDAQKNFNKIWREQNERFYLKSLDHQGPNFKQNDLKMIRSKALLNEIEVAFDERHEMEQRLGNAYHPEPHLRLSFPSRECIEYAKDLLIYVVKRQSGLQKEDKQKIKQLLNHLIPDMFYLPRGQLSDDEDVSGIDNTDDSESGNSSALDDERMKRREKREKLKEQVCKIKPRNRLTEEEAAAAEFQLEVLRKPEALVRGKGGKGRYSKRKGSAITDRRSPLVCMETLPPKETDRSSTPGEVPDVKGSDLDQQPPAKKERTTDDEKMDVGSLDAGGTAVTGMDVDEAKPAEDCGFLPKQNTENAETDKNIDTGVEKSPHLSKDDSNRGTPDDFIRADFDSLAERLRVKLERQDTCDSSSIDSEGRDFLLDPAEYYTVFFANNSWYLFLRLHQILCERIAKMESLALKAAEEERRHMQDRKESTAIALRLKNPNMVEPDDYFTHFIELVQNLIDGNLEQSQFEDTLRELYGVNSYIAFTIDKVITNAVRQLQHLVQQGNDPFNQQTTDLFYEFRSRRATGGLFETRDRRVNLEFAYQRKAEQMLAEENCFKIHIWKNAKCITFELMENDNLSEITNEAIRHSRYVDNFLSYDQTFTREMRRSMMQKPVFLLRNLRLALKEIFPQKGGTSPNERSSDQDADNQTKTTDWETETGFSSSQRHGQDNTADHQNTDTCSREDLLNELDEASTLLLQRQLSGSTVDSGNDKPLVVVDNEEIQFQPHTFRIVFVTGSNSFLYRIGSLSKAKKTHKKVTLKLNKSFDAFLSKWAADNISQDSDVAVRNWFRNSYSDSDQKINTVTRGMDMTRPPYHTYCRYLSTKEST